MNTDTVQKDVLRRYIEAWNRGDVDAVVALFAPDAVFRDPYGADPVIGQEAIRAHLELGRDLIVGITPDSAIRGSHGDRAAVAFTLELRIEGRIQRVGTIVVVTCDEEGRISTFDSHWGPSDME